MSPQFPELSELERLANLFHRQARVEQVGSIKHLDRSYPLITFCLGSKDPTAPVLGLVGGVHGLERIGTQVVLAYLHSLIERLSWDETLHWQLERVRVVCMPLVNPAGMNLRKRSNGNGVDLMRNGPVVAEQGASFLVGGQRLSRSLPWFMGDEGAPMEAESQALCDFIRREVFASRSAILVDAHSGFGIFDQLWFPYAKTRDPYPGLAEVYGLKRLYDRIYPHHVYKFEPQAKNYTTHGDLWDHLYDEQRTLGGDRLFVPLTLEMGSWNWVKKNPLQLFSYLGAFNPVKPHRQKRILRRHMPLFDFLMRSVLSPAGWAPSDDQERRVFDQAARKLWY